MSLSNQKNENQLTPLRASFLAARARSAKIETELNDLKKDAKKAHSQNDAEKLEKINAAYLEKQSEYESSVKSVNERRAELKAYYLSGKSLDWQIFSGPGKILDGLSQSWREGFVTFTATEITVAEQEIVGEIIRADVKLKSGQTKGAAFRLEIEENFGSCWIGVSFKEIVKRFLERGWISAADAERLLSASTLDVLNEQKGETDL